MDAFLADLGNWTWWIVAIVLGILELLVPGIFFIWLAVAAAIVGALLLIIDIPMTGQIALFAVLSIMVVWLSRRWLKQHPIISDHPMLNQRAKTYIGKNFVLEQAIINGRGKLKIGDSLWLASGPELPAGASVRVTGESDGVLQVEAV